MSIKILNEIIPSVVLFFAALIIFAYTYTSIINESAANHTLVQNISEGSQKYHINNLSDCIGEFEYSLNSQNNIYMLLANGSFSIQIDKNIINPSFDIQATFNSIGQLGGSLLRVSTNNSFFSIGTSGIDPINIKLRTKIENVASENNLSIAGPINLIKQKDSLFKIEFSQFPKLKDYSSSLFEPTISFLSQISLKKNDANSDKCSVDKRNKFDLTTHAHFLSFLASQAAPLVEGNKK